MRAKRRKIVLTRCGGVCETPGCTARATDVDHVQRGDNHDVSNLQGLCHPHHAEKTQQEAREGARRRAERIKRPPEQHPGLIGFEPPQYPKYDNRNTTSGKDDQNDQ